MDKLQFGSFDEEKDLELVFDENSGYGEPNNEDETRRQLSKPLTELRDYVNNTVTVNSVDMTQAYQLGLDRNRVIKYRTGPGDSWKETHSAGHTVVDENDVELEPKLRIQFVGATAWNDGTTTYIEGLKGDTGPRGLQGPPFMLKGRVDSVEALSRILNPSIGDAYMVGNTQSERDNIYLYGNSSPTALTGSWIYLGNYLQSGAVGPQGPQGEGLNVLGLYGTLADLQTAHPTGEAGDAYAVGTSSSNEIYIWNSNEWTSIGPIKGDTGPRGEDGYGVPGEGTEGQILTRYGTGEEDYEWTDPPIDTVYTPTSDNAQSGGAVQTAIQSLFPADSLYVTSTNVNPNSASSLGFGQWTLVDKEFAEEIISSTDDGFNLANYFTINSDNVTSVSDFKLYRSGKQVRITMKVLTKIKFVAKTTYSLGTFVLSGLGIKNTFKETDAVNQYGSGLYMSVRMLMDGADPKLNKVRTDGDVSASNTIRIDISPIITKDDMENSACDKFYWRRTS